MQKLRVFTFIIILFTIPTALTAQEKNIVMGANVFDEGFIPPTAQDAEIRQLAA